MGDVVGNGSTALNATGLNATGLNATAPALTVQDLLEFNTTYIAGKLQEAADEVEPGLAFAYFMLMLMAIFPIYVASHQSVKRHLDDPDSEGTDEDEIEVMTAEDAYQFPLYASCGLGGLYVLFKLLGKEYVNLLLGGYFFTVAMISGTVVLRPVVKVFCPESWVEGPFSFRFTQKVESGGATQHGEKDQSDEKIEEAEVSKETGVSDDSNEKLHFELAFDYVDLVSLAITAVIGGWYVLTKHWIANNIFGISFCLNGIEFMSLGSFKIAAILLCGLFVYDVWWVFGTEVMVTVAKSVDAPIKVLFPKDFFVNGLAAKECAMLGLGDIVFPGVLIALLLRFDTKQGRGSWAPYFHTTCIAYVFGLFVTIVVMHTFQSAQPALLYLVPACLLAPLLLSVVRREVGELFAYTEEKEEEVVTEAKEKKDN